MVELLKRHHYNKPPLNDERSAKIYDGYLKMLDPARMYFTAGDIAEFDRWRNRFDDFLKSGDLDPGFVIYKRHLDRLKVGSTTPWRCSTRASTRSTSASTRAC